MKLTFKTEKYYGKNVKVSKMQGIFFMIIGFLILSAVVYGTLSFILGFGGIFSNWNYGYDCEENDLLRNDMDNAISELGNIKQNYEIVVTAIAFAIVIIVYLCGNFDNSLFLGALGIIATFYFGVLKYKIENDKMFQELFISFNNRYETKFNDLINTLRGNPENALDEDGKKDNENLIIDYFNLCAEEYLWYSKNRVPKSVWDAWIAGIKENLEVDQVRKVYEKETKTKQ